MDVRRLAPPLTQVGGAERGQHGITVMQRQREPERDPGPERGGRGDTVQMGQIFVERRGRLAGDRAEAAQGPAHPPSHGGVHQDLGDHPGVSAVGPYEKFPGRLYVERPVVASRRECPGAFHQVAQTLDAAHLLLIPQSRDQRAVLLARRQCLDHGRTEDDGHEWALEQIQPLHRFHRGRTIRPVRLARPQVVARRVTSATSDAEVGDGPVRVDEAVQLPFQRACGHSGIGRGRVGGSRRRRAGSRQRLVHGGCSLRRLGVRVVGFGEHPGEVARADDYVRMAGAEASGARRQHRPEVSGGAVAVAEEVPDRREFVPGGEGVRASTS